MLKPACIKARTPQGKKKTEITPLRSTSPPPDAHGTETGLFWKRPSERRWLKQLCCIQALPSPPPKLIVGTKNCELIEALDEK